MPNFSSQLRPAIYKASVLVGLLLACCALVRIYNWFQQPREPMARLDCGSEVRSMGIAPTHDVVAIGAGHVILWDLARFDNAAQELSDTLTYKVAFMSSSEVIAADYRSGVVERISVNKPDERRAMLAFPAHAEHDMVVAKDGTMFAVSTTQTTIARCSDGEVVFSVPIAAVTLDFSPDSRVLALADAFGRLVLYETGDGAVIGECVVRERIAAVAFRPGCDEIAVASKDGALALYESPKLETKGEPWCTDFAAASLAFSGDGMRLAGGDSKGFVRIWNLADAQELERFRAHRGKVSSIVFDGPGARLVTGSTDCSAKLWSVANVR